MNSSQLYFDNDYSVEIIERCKAYGPIQGDPFPDALRKETSALGLRPEDRQNSEGGRAGPELMQSQGDGGGKSEHLCGPGGATGHSAAMETP